MRTTRCPEARIFGYAIERLEEFDDAGLHASSRFEVICPRTNKVLGAFDEAQSAKRYVIVHELRAIREATQRLNAGMRVA